MANKFYAVKIGKTPGIYDNWDQCKKQVIGVKGSQFKGFASKKEAQEWLEGTSGTNTIKTEATVYVDGSYNPANGHFSYGAVVLHNGQELCLNKAFEDEELSSMRNVAGEIKGAQAAMDYCIAHGIKSVTIFHDYLGLAKWCTGEWKATKPGTKDYVEHYKNASEQILIQFRHVKGHTGDTYNEMADQLAKQALGLS